MKKFTIAISIILITSVLLVPNVKASEPEEGIVYQITKSYTLKNYGDHESVKENVSFPAIKEFPDLANMEIITENLQINKNYGEIIYRETEDNRRILIKNIEQLSPGDSVKIINRYIVRIAPFSKQNPEQVQGTIPSDIKEEYTKSVEGLWHVKNPLIENIANGIIENISNQYYQAEQILNYVQDRLEYKTQSKAHDDLWAYKNREGDCSEYAILFISLARAADIPAKFSAGYLYSLESDKVNPRGLGRFGHAWAYIYLPNVGWTPVDPTESGSDGGGFFAELTSFHIPEMVSDGSNMETGSISEVPGADLDYVYYEGRETVVDFVPEESNVSILPKVAVEFSSINSTIDEDNRLVNLDVEVSNRGIEPVSELTLSVEGENRYFGFPENSSIEHLRPEEDFYREFSVRVENNMDNFDANIVVKAGYDSENYGTFISKEEIPISIRFRESESPTESIDFVDKLFENIYLFIIMIVIILVLVAVVRR